MVKPFGLLKYLYVGCGDFERDFRYYKEVLGAEVLWNFHEFGAHVAAFRMGEGPQVLLADHRPAPSCMPIFIVDDLDATVKRLKSKGWAARSGPFEIPDGPCYTFDDPSGNPYAFFQNDRPDALLGGRAPPSGRKGRSK